MDNHYTEIIHLGSSASAAADSLAADRTAETIVELPYSPDAIEKLRSSAILLLEAGVKILRALEDEVPKQG